MIPERRHSIATATRNEAMNTSESQRSHDVESAARCHAVAPRESNAEAGVGSFQKSRPATRREAPPAIGCTAPGGLDPKTGRPDSRPGSRRGTASTARLLSLPEAAAYLGLSWWTTRELVMGGTIPAVRLPAPRATHGRMLRRILIDVADLDALISKWKDRSV